MQTLTITRSWLVAGAVLLNSCVSALDPDAPGFVQSYLDAETSEWAEHYPQIHEARRFGKAPSVHIFTETTKDQAGAVSEAVDILNMDGTI